MVQGHRKGRVRRAGGDEDCGELDQEHHVTLDLPCGNEKPGLPSFDFCKRTWASRF